MADRCSSAIVTYFGFPCVNVDISAACLAPNCRHEWDVYRNLSQSHQLDPVVEQRASAKAAFRQWSLGLDGWPTAELVA